MPETRPNTDALELDTEPLPTPLSDVGRDATQPPPSRPGIARLSSASTLLSYVRKKRNAAFPELDLEQDAPDPACDNQRPEGRYGWVVIGAASVLCFLFVGTSYSWGIIQAALARDYHVSNPATISFIGSLASALISALAIVNGKLLNKYGARSMALWGVALMVLGETLSSLAVGSVGGLFVTFGVVFGVGMRYVALGRAVSRDEAKREAGRRLTLEDAPNSVCFMVSDRSLVAKLSWQSTPYCTRRSREELL
jgi:hypothetical protein